MRKSIYLTILLPILFSACSPRIVTTVKKQQTALNEQQEITIYNHKEQVPDGYELLGTVSVGESGATIRCDSLRMINLVKRESRKIGGNAVLITEHTPPSFWGSSCHQFKGIILNVPDIEPKARNMELEAVALSLSKQRALSRFTFSGNIGPGWRTDKIASGLSDFQRDFYKKMRSGFQTNISADYFFSDHYGIRLAYQNFYSTHSALATDGYIVGDLDGKDIINAVYPAFVVRLSTPKRKWLFDCSLAFGYIHLTEKFVFPDKTFTEMTGSTICSQLTLGAEYRFTDSWGIGLGVFSTTGILNEAKMNNNGYVETINLSEKKMAEGLNHTSLLLGLKYHIK